MLRTGLGILLLVVCGLPAQAADIEAYLKAKSAFKAGDDAALDRAATALGGDVLEPYAIYWQASRRLDRADAVEVAGFLQRLEPGSFLHNQLRQDWALRLATEERWDEFDAAEARVERPDADLRCYRQLSLLSRHGRVEQEAWELWDDASARGEGCQAMTLAMHASGLADDARLWERVRGFWTAGRAGEARGLAGAAFGSAVSSQLAGAWKDPAGAVRGAGQPEPDSPQGQALLLALTRLAVREHHDAAALWQKVEARYKPADRAYVWSRLAAEAARDHDPVAGGWFHRAGPQAGDAERAWKVRQALRDGRWRDVEQGVAGMSASAREEPRWRYWRAVALEHLGRGAEGRALLSTLISGDDFYGLLAREELGEPVEDAPAGYRAGPAEVAAVAAEPGIRRAFALNEAGDGFPGRREWNWTIRDWDDRRLLAAARLASDRQWYDRMVSSAGRTERLHDYSLAYPTPFTTLVRSKAGEHMLDVPWIYGLMRQESRFEASARSWAGASGLMQIMPATGRWLAGRMGMKGFREGQLTDVETNISMGTYYMRHALDILDDLPVLATAGYNAGPGRARRWRDDRHSLDGAVYAESIPFDETRDYVNKVMTNAVHYSRHLGEGSRSLKERLGVVAPKD